MSLKNRIIKAGAGLALAGVITSVHTYEAEAASWQPRTVSEIRSDIQAQAAGQDGAVEYTFQWGDSLWGISQATGISTNKLAQVNNIEHSSLIVVGNSIYLSENGSVLTVEDENHQVKSYDVSEEEVKETETPEEVEKQAAQGQTAEEKQAAKVEAAQVQAGAADAQAEDTEEETPQEADIDSQEQEGNVEADLEEETSQDVDEGSDVDNETAQTSNEETGQGNTDETEGIVEDTEDSESNEETDNQNDQNEFNEDVDNTNSDNGNSDYIESNDTDSDQANSNDFSTNTENTKVLGAHLPAPTTNVLSIGESEIGTPYAYGGTTPAGFDCSGFIQWVFAQAGKSVPRTTGAQYSAATPVSNPQPGDLVFFSDGSGGVQHSGIYAGNGQFLGAQSSTGVAYASVSGPYWGPKLMGYGRI